MAFNTSIEELLKMFCAKMNIPEEKIRENIFKFLYNGNNLKISDKKTLYEYGFTNGSNITVNETYNEKYSNIYKGKTLEVLIKIDCKNLDIKWIVGTLEKINEFYKSISHKIIYEVFAGDINIKKISINGKEIKENDERTFSSFGIIENCICKIETEKKNNL